MVAYIRRAFCVSIFISRLVKYIIVSMKYRYYWQKLSFYKQKSSLFCFKIYLNPSWYLFMFWLSAYLPVLERFKGWNWFSYNTLFSGGLYSGFYGMSNQFKKSRMNTYSPISHYRYQAFRGVEGKHQKMVCL